jgi:hypothetical protein
MQVSVGSLALQLAAIVAFAGSVGAQPPQTSASAASACGISDDKDYAYSPKGAVAVGGGPMYVAARERRYLDALRGPAGAPVKYRRIGSQLLDASDPTVILDSYEVTSDGLDKPVVLYLDAYHFDDELKAPRGFTCGVAIELSDPGPDLFRAMDSLARTALRDSAAADAPGIPLDAAEAGRVGVVFDRYRLISRSARAAAAAGKSLTFEEGRPVPGLRVRTVVVALPRTCDGKPVAPATIELEARFPNRPPLPAKREGDYVTGPALAALVPGYDVPPSALGATFQLETLRPTESVRIGYGEGCSPVQVTTNVTYSGARLLASPPPTLPADAAPSPASVRLQVTIALDGSFRDPYFVGGARHLFDAASEIVETAWKAEPARINGAPVSTPVTLLVKFLSR